MRIDIVVDELPGLPKLWRVTVNGRPIKSFKSEKESIKMVERLRRKKTLGPSKKKRKA